MPTFISPRHKIRSAYRRLSNLAATAAWLGAVLVAAFTLVWVVWVIAVGYDDMTPAQQDQAAANFRLF